jgi:hypothetical protein
MVIGLPSRKRSYGFHKCCEAVKAEVSLVDVASRYTALRQAGKDLRGRCPLHGGDNASAFSVSPEKQQWYCFRCAEGGDVIDLHFHCGSFGEKWEAMIDLAVEFNVTLPERSKSWHNWQETKSAIRNVAEEARKEVRRERLFKLLVLSGPEFEIEDSEERRAAIEQAWEVFESGMERIGQ